MNRILIVFIILVGLYVSPIVSTCRPRNICSPAGSYSSCNPQKGVMCMISEYCNTTSCVPNKLEGDPCGSTPCGSTIYCIQKNCWTPGIKTYGESFSNSIQCGGEMSKYYNSTVCTRSLDDACTVNSECPVQYYCDARLSNCRQQGREGESCDPSYNNNYDDFAKTNIPSSNSSLIGQCLPHLSCIAKTNNTNNNNNNNQSDYTCQLKFSLKSNMQCNNFDQCGINLACISGKCLPYKNQDNSSKVCSDDRDCIAGSEICLCGPNSSTNNGAGTCKAIVDTSVECVDALNTYYQCMSYSKCQDADSPWGRETCANKQCGKYFCAKMRLCDHNLQNVVLLNSQPCIDSTNNNPICSQFNIAFIPPKICIVVESNCRPNQKCSYNGQICNNGIPCVFSQECILNMDEMEYRCMDKRDEGSKCGKDCGGGMTCYNGECYGYHTLTLGETCLVDAQCGGGSMKCIGAPICNTSGRCSNGVCVTGQTGLSCSDNSQCLKTQCTSSGEGPGKCQKLLTSDNESSCLKNSECPPSDYCDVRSFQCRNKGREGEACDPAYNSKTYDQISNPIANTIDQLLIGQCLPHLSCVKKSDTQFHSCQLKFSSKLNQPCNHYDQCSIGLACIKGHCEKYSKSNGTATTLCSGDTDCIEGVELCMCGPYKNGMGICQPIIDSSPQCIGAIFTYYQCMSFSRCQDSDNPWPSTTCANQQCGKYLCDKMSKCDYAIHDVYQSGDYSKCFDLGSRNRVCSQFNTLFIPPFGLYSNTTKQITFSDDDHTPSLDSSLSVRLPVQLAISSSLLLLSMALLNILII
ncbi:hypothetical protein DFA_01542 [Cavenderia fasciculata]|uniref:Dickkopf N-terminal cysteine-rich domain-containing protein n=1 Tax=Cavenderia fasciculata TaxID=261658 RepID=F4PTD4_CACFS|nr:uncharacterized protein DFA_01542 [Cavenderia fasciculata]EGG21656.1 hypothetical protein DFA_01542 [Cavenderia fasciculata]|eukprot:XP_004359506.1 hypothetical protein DFA_01542 [Cavenderia fasciculata]